MVLEVEDLPVDVGLAGVHQEAEVDLEIAVGSEIVAEGEVVAHHFPVVGEDQGAVLAREEEDESIFCLHAFSRSLAAIKKAQQDPCCVKSQI